MVPKNKERKDCLYLYVSNTDYNLHKIMMITGHGRIEKLLVKKRKMRED